MEEIPTFDGVHSQERRARVLREQIDPAHVAAQRVQALVPQDFAELPDRSRSRREEPQHENGQDRDPDPAAV